MSREELLASLQRCPWHGCGESDGPPRYRAAEAYYCTYCGYTLCAACYNAIPTALLFPTDRHAGADGEEALRRPHCHLCGTGALCFESTPAHQWSCEGPLPERRLRARAAFDVHIIQQYYTMKEQQRARALSTGALVAHFHGDASFGASPAWRPPHCAEGEAFLYSVENPRAEVRCVWCAVRRDAREGHPSLAGEETVTPLAEWRCPPTLPGLPRRRFRVSVPTGANRLHALALYTAEDVFAAAPRRVERKALLSVDVLHRRAGGEAALALDLLLHGRSVAVGGIASKRFFLRSAAQSAALRAYGLSVVDAHSPHAARALLEAARRLRDGAEREALRRHPADAPPRARAPPRSETTVSPTHSEGTVSPTRGGAAVGGETPMTGRREGSTLLARGGDTPAPRHGAKDGPSLGFRRYSLREPSAWNYDVPRAAAAAPRYAFASGALMRAVRRVCRAPVRACAAWLSLPSFTAARVVPSASPALARAPHVLLVHGLDRLEAAQLLALQSLARENRHGLLLFGSFDDPAWPSSTGAALLDVFRPFVLHLRSLLLPRVAEMGTANSLALLTELEASNGRPQARGGAMGSLPMHDTIRRILFSLPTTFAELLRCMIERQDVAGENVYVPMALHQSHFDERGVMVSMGRLKAIERELTSNRLAFFDAAENKLMIPQHKKLLKVLEEVTAERQRGDDTSAAVEA